MKRMDGQSMIEKDRDGEKRKKREEREREGREEKKRKSEKETKRGVGPESGDWRR